MKKIRKTKFYKSLDRYLACAYAEGFCEGENASEEEKITAWQYLIDISLVWQLPEWYSRTASNLIEEGVCLPHNKQ